MFAAAWTLLSLPNNEYQCVPGVNRFHAESESFLDMTCLLVDLFVYNPCHYKNTTPHTIGKFTWISDTNRNLYRP